MPILLGPRLRAGVGVRLMPQRVRGNATGDPVPLKGLQFPSNGDAPEGTLVAFRFTGTNMPNITPLTLIWRYKPFQQTGYYVTFFHARQDGNFIGDWTYFGCHPYPPAGASGTEHNWEIAVEGTDDITDENGNNTTVVKNQWYTQAATAYPNAGVTRIDFYWDLTTSSNRLIRHDTQSPLTNASDSPGLIFGEAPWAPGAERMSGVLGAVKIFNAQLSAADIQSEAADMTQIVTSAGAAARWWFKPTYTSVDDLTDSTTGKSAAWVNSNKATLVDI